MPRGKYIRTLETLKKLSSSLKKNNGRYWLGKKIPRKIVEKIKKSKIRNGKKGNLDFFKNHKYIGEKHKLWKGDNVGYEGLHSWLYRQLGKPETCEFCGRTGLKGRYIHWANKSHEYKRIKSDWLRLCAKCHYHYDRD